MPHFFKRKTVFDGLDKSFINRFPTTEHQFIYVCFLFNNFIGLWASTCKSDRQQFKQHPVSASNEFNNTWWYRNRNTKISKLVLTGGTCMPNVHLYQRKEKTYTFSLLAYTKVQASTGRVQEKYNAFSLNFHWPTADIIHFTLIFRYFFFSFVSDS